MNPVSVDEHVPEAERYIRTIKERSRCVQTTLPLKKIPVRITMELVSSCVFWLKICPRKSGVSNTMSPRNIITGLTIDYLNHCKINFGKYVQTHESHEKITGTALTIGYPAFLTIGNEK